MDGDGIVPAASAVPAAAVPPPSTSVSYETLKDLSGEAFLKTLPAEFAQKGYMKGVENLDGLLKKFDGAQSLIGQRATPLPTDAPELWAKWHAQVAPKSAAEYRLDGVGDDIKSLMYKSGASAWQAKQLVDGYNAIAQAAMDAEDKAFAASLDKVLGPGKEETLAKAKQVMSVALPADMQAIVSKLDGNQFAAVAALTKAIADKFGGADNIIKSGAAPVVGRDALIGEMRQHLAVSMDTNKSLAERKTAEEAINKIRGQLT